MNTLPMTIDKIPLRVRHITYIQDHIFLLEPNEKADVMRRIISCHGYSAVGWNQEVQEVNTNGLCDTCLAEIYQYTKAILDHDKIDFSDILDASGKLISQIN